MLSALERIVTQLDANLRILIQKRNFIVDKLTIRNSDIFKWALRWLQVFRLVILRSLLWLLQQVAMYIVIGV